MKKCFYTLASVLSLLLAIYACESIAFSLPLVNPDELSYPPLQFTPPRAQKVTLGNGIILYVLDDHEIPLINVSAVIRTGSIHDLTGKEGLAELTGRVMRTGGTKFLSGNEVDESLEFFAGTFSLSVNRESTTVHFSVLKKDLDEGLNLLSQVLRYPSFEEDKLNLAKALKTEELRRMTDDPQKFAFREFNRLMYRDNPRGRVPIISSVENIRREDLLLFHKRFFHPQNIMITVTGDIKKADAIDKMKRYFGGWPSLDIQKDAIPPPAKQEGRIYFLSKDIPQSIIICGNLAPSKRNVDAYSFEVLDFIIGSGGFRSRIFQQIRSDLGLAYSAGSFYRAMSDYGVFGAYAITSTDSTPRVLSLIRSIIDDVKRHSISPSELDWAKNSINNSFIFSFLSANQIAHQQMMNAYDRLPEDYLTTYRDNIGKVIIDDVRLVAGKYLSFHDATTIVVGNEKLYDLLQSMFGNVHKIEGAL
jgi:zinc protease